MRKKTGVMMKKVGIEDVYSDLKTSANAFSGLFEEIKDDYRYFLGDQWDQDKASKLEERGVKALTINKIKSLIRLITGIERQSKTDFKSFPEGGEDQIVADVVDRLLKNIMKTSKGNMKLSDMFESGMVSGLSYIEAYMDYTFDLMNGELKFKKIKATNVYIDPSSEEYDLSDSKYMIKLVKGLDRDDLSMLFPGKESVVDNLAPFVIGPDSIDGVMKHSQERDYPDESTNVNDSDSNEVEVFDLIEYYYKSPKKVYYVVDRVNGKLKRTEDKEEADSFADNFEGAVVIERNEPEIRVKKVVGKEELSDETAWTYPRWKSYPIVPFFPDYISEDLGLETSEEKKLTIQGTVRPIKDIQYEYNKRRTQALHHLNSSINSGNFIPKDALDRQNQTRLKRYGSAPGVNIYYDPEKTGGVPPTAWRINPAPLSQGHVQLAAENAQDLKDGSGVNPDLLANDSQSQSGRAILAKQRQGLVMVQKPLDNYDESKGIIARLLLSQLGEIFTVEKAIRVLGEEFLNSNDIFKSPVHEINEKTKSKIDAGDKVSEREVSLLNNYPTASEDNPALDGNGRLVLAVDKDTVFQIINKVLQDSDLGKFDVNISRSVYNETMKMTNHLAMLELSERIPMPPDLIIETSLLETKDKERAIDFIRSQQQAQSQAAGS